MSEKRNEFMTRVKVEGDRAFAAMQRSGETRRNLANAQKENAEAKQELRGKEKMNEPDAIFAAMNNSGRLREKLAKAEAEVESSKSEIR